MATEEAEAKALNERLIKYFPSLSKDVEDYTAWQEGMETGSFLVYEDVFLPYVRHLIMECDTSSLAHVGDFIERLIDDGGYAENVARVGILEGLKATEDPARLHEFLGPKSYEAFMQLQY